MARHPRMQLYLATDLGVNAGVNDVDYANDAALVYHEYTHGLSSRLITDASGMPALFEAQPAALGEGWSDWYPMDYLVAQGFERDTPADGEVRFGTYESNPSFRSEGLDCPVGAAAPACPGGTTAHSGGYTYGDFGQICCGEPEAHADGEIWAQTLWDLRALIAAHGPAEGLRRGRTLVTGGMRLSPPQPDFLEARDAILAENAAARLGDRDLIWGVFAARGMGSGASTTGPIDANPVEDFTVPPAVADPVSSPDPPAPNLDARAPHTRLYQGPPRRTHRRRVRLVFGWSESGSSFECRIDRGAFRACVSPSRTAGCHSANIECVLGSRRAGQPRPNAGHP